MTAFTRETKTEAYVIWDRYLAFCAHLNLVVVHRLVDSGGAFGELGFTFCNQLLLY